MEEEFDSLDRALTILSEFSDKVIYSDDETMIEVYIDSQYTEIVLERMILLGWEKKNQYKNKQYITIVFKKLIFN